MRSDRGHAMQEGQRVAEGEGGGRGGIEGSHSFGEDGREGLKGERQAGVGWDTRIANWDGWVD